MKRSEGWRASSIYIAAIALVGCTSMAGQDGAVTREGVPVTASTAGPGLSVTSTTLKLQPGDCDTKKCLIEVTVRGTSCTSTTTITVNPPTLTLGTIGNRRIVWELADSTNFEFCPSRGDGVFLQSRQRRQFESPSATSSEAGDDESVPEDQCRKRFRVFNWNNDQFLYAYALQFSDKNGKTCKVDPWIKNGGSSLMK